MTPTEQIKEKIDIVDFIKGYIELRPAGKYFKANCPFHQEKTPSFIVSPDRQTWHCFGSCGEGGDIFKFLMKYENIEFYEALKILAEKAGIELKKISPVDQKQFGILYDINNSAKDFFKKKLLANSRVKKYLEERGLKDKAINEFEIGFAPQAYEELTLDLINLGYDIKDIERAGLNFKSEKGNYIDRFRGRIMFPIFNHFGKIVGFSGRIMPEYDNGETGKYINSPETAIYNKSKILYGFHKAKNFIRQENQALLVEGQMDFLMSYQDGVKNAVATSGTALTEDHLRALRRQTDNLIFSFDSDEAGLKAAERSIDLADNLDFNVKILTLQDSKDPAETVLKHPGLMVDLVKKSKPVMEFYFDRYINNKQPAGSSGKPDIGEFKKNLRIVLYKIKNLISPIERDYWIKELSLLVNIGEQVLVQEMTQLSEIKKENRTEKNLINNQLQITAPTRRDLIGERLIALTIIKDSLKNKMEEYFQYLPEKFQKIFNYCSKKEPSDDSEIARLADDLVLRSSLEIEKTDMEKIDEEFSDLLKQLRSESLKEKRNELMRAIKEAERKKDEQKLSEVLKQFDELSKLLQN